MRRRTSCVSESLNDGSIAHFLRLYQRRSSLKIWLRLWALLEKNKDGIEALRGDCKMKGRLTVGRAAKIDVASFLVKVTCMRGLEPPKRFG